MNYLVPKGTGLVGSGRGREGAPRRYAQVGKRRLRFPLWRRSGRRGVCSSPQLSLD